MRPPTGLTVAPFLIHRTVPGLELRQRQRNEMSVPTVNLVVCAGRVVIAATLHIPGMEIKLFFCFRTVFSWVSKVISRLLWVCITTLCDWLTKLASLSQPMGIQTKTNRVLAARVFPRLAPVTVLTILCMLGLKFLELFCAFLWTFLGLSYVKNYGYQ